jgi:hypothetical protein
VLHFVNHVLTLDKVCKQNNVYMYGFITLVDWEVVLYSNSFIDSDGRLH